MRAFWIGRSGRMAPVGVSVTEPDDGAVAATLPAPVAGAGARTAARTNVRTAVRRAQRRLFRPLLPHRIRDFRRPHWWEEILFIGISYVVYSLIRNGVPLHEKAALARAWDVFHAEQWLHLDVEHAINVWTASVHPLVQVVNYYYATLHFVVTIGVLVWLYVRHPWRYRSIRSVLYATNVVALLGFWLMPLAPPRMLHSAGFIDTVVAFHTWGSWGSGDVASASNQFAAMPSLHVAWATWCGIALFRLSRRTWVRVLGVVYPCATTYVVIATANHFVADVAGGLLVLAAGFGVQVMLSGRPAYAEPPPPLPRQAAVHASA